MSDLKKVGLIYKSDGSADFVKSLKSVNSEIRENYQQMKITQNSWDESTKASDKLRDKVANLSKAYELNEKKLVVLNEELVELKNNENATEDQIKSKEAQIKSVEATMSRYDKSIKNLNKSLQSGVVDIEAFGKKLQNTGQKVTEAGKKASVFSAAYTAALGIAVKAASEWESAWTNVLKVTDGTDEQLDDLAKSIRGMSMELPVSATEIAGVVEAASKLGVGIDHVEDFAETMVKMEIATGIAAADSATAIARFAEITNMSMEDVGRLGSVIAELGDSFATTEQEIIDMSMGLAAAGSQVGMHQSDIMALATGLSAVGIEAQAGGSAMSKLMVNMELATKTGDGLLDFAKVANVSGEEFANIFENDATKAISMFIGGLSDINKDGGSAIKTLDDMGIKEVRLRDALLRAANASDTFTDAIDVGSKAWEKNTKLTEEAELQADTLANQWQLTKNMLNEIAIMFGELVMPVIKDFVSWIQNLLKSFTELSPGMQKIIVVVGGLLAAIGPILIVVGKLMGAVGSIMANAGLIMGIITKVGALLSGLLNPITLIIAGIALLATVIIKNWDTIKEWTLNLIETLTEVFSNFTEWIINIWDSIKENILNVWNSIKESITDAMKQVSDVITSVFETIKDFIVNFWNTITDIVTNTITNILSVLELPIEFIKNAVLLIIALLAIMLESIYNKIIKPLVEYFITGVTVILDFIKTGITFIVDAFKSTVESIKTFFKNAFEWIMNSVITPFNNFFVNVFRSISNFVSNVTNNIKNAFNQAILWVRNSVIAPLTNFFSNTFNSILNVINNAITRIKSGFKSIASYVSSVFNGVKNTVVNIFSSIGQVIKTPINGVIRLINNVLSSLNKIKIPSWVPGLGGKGINFPMIRYLAKGGNLLGGTAIVGEAGPELLQSGGGRTTVTPLSDGGGAVKREIIDYVALAKAIFNEFRNAKFDIDEDGIMKLVDKRFLEVM